MTILRYVVSAMCLVTICCCVGSRGRMNAPAGSRTDRAEDPAERAHGISPQRTRTRSTPRPNESQPVVESGLFEVEVPDGEAAVVALPTSGQPEPLLVAAHGAGDGPEWQCALWRQLLGNRGVVLCPAGRSLGRESSGYYFPDHHELERIILASERKVREVFGERIDPGPAVYAAYSQGATMGALMVVAHGKRFPRLILIEGGYSQWSVQRGLDYRKSGGERVLFACGTRNCERHARRSAEWLSKAGLDTQVESVPDAGHTYGGAVAQRVQSAFGWIVAGDARWEGAPAAP